MFVITIYIFEVNEHVENKWNIKMRRNENDVISFASRLINAKLRMLFSFETCWSWVQIGTWAHEWMDISSSMWLQIISFVFLKMFSFLSRMTMTLSSIKRWLVDGSIIPFYVSKWSFNYFCTESAIVNNFITMPCVS